jgi:6-pyruvoyltetrahydropterin/6-carboxytetrahydropterin synthase
MDNVVAIRKLEFEAGHRVVGHENKCKNVHGHNFVIDVYARSKVNKLDKVGRIIDFSVLKEIIGGWLDKNWDHGFLYYYGEDDIMTPFFRDNPTQKNYSLNFNPTAENLSEYLVEIVFPQLFKDMSIEIFKIKMYETSKSMVTYEKR